MALDWKRKHLIVLSGPTSVGKTDLSLRLAGHWGSAILSADSRQIYRQMTIGTAKPSKAVLAEVPHYFINHIDVDTPFSAGQYEREGTELLHRLFGERDVALLCGGTGLYIDALCTGFDPLPNIPDVIKSEVMQEYEMVGIAPFQKELLAKDPEYHHEVDLSNPRRILRAIEVIRTSGRPFSDFRVGRPVQRPFHVHYVLLHRERAELYRLIDQRVDQMMAAGLLDEAHTLLPYRNLPALDTVGYRELFRYFDGEWSLDEAVEKIKTHSRRYAKRQGTWFRRDTKWTVFAADDSDGILSHLRRLIDRTGPGSKT